MTEFKRYRRTQIAEMTDWEPGLDMASVSVSEVDRRGGSPKSGDKIARNPANHDDQWLVSAEYFEANFEPLDAAVLATAHGAVSVTPSCDCVGPGSSHDRACPAYDPGAVSE